MQWLSLAFFHSARGATRGQVFPVPYGLSFDAITASALAFKSPGPEMTVIPRYPRFHRAKQHVGLIFLWTVLHDPFNKYSLTLFLTSMNSLIVFGRKILWGVAQ